MTDNRTDCKQSLWQEPLLPARKLLVHILQESVNGTPGRLLLEQFHRQLDAQRRDGNHTNRNRGEGAQLFS
jgi:hypothetical protein